MNVPVLKNLIGLIIGVAVVLLLLWGVMHILQPVQPVTVKRQPDPVKQEEEKAEPPSEVLLTLGEVTDPYVRAKGEPPKATEPTRHTKTIEVITPDQATINLGKQLLATDQGQRYLPKIYGSYQALGGMEQYLTEMKERGGRLFLFDRTGKRGISPVVELALPSFKSVSSKTSGYRFDRPRFLPQPYSSGINRKIDIWETKDPGSQLVPALVLPYAQEAYLLGALKRGLQDKLADFSSLHGTYRKEGSTGLSLTIDRGQPRGAPNGQTSPLPKIIRIEVGRYK